ncbi:hypothetical protein Franean1_4471 [Parafrankia sp. EAN1pec]|uniref:hypothetical protein n=1 Tax=Parafrankia sp. (strain EAN1pec) TaxID=298653 RepID=UPI0000544AD5|nr:hypothetical protein Franean1_4471 [Frankia sp. EAN1pec]
MGNAATPLVRKARSASNRVGWGRRAQWTAGMSLATVLASAILAITLPDHTALITIRAIAFSCFFLSGLVCIVTGLRRRGTERLWRLLVAVMMLAVGTAAVAIFLDLLAGAPPVPRLTGASMVYLVPCAFGLAGLLLYPSDRHRPGEDTVAAAL